MPETVIRGAELTEPLILQGSALIENCVFSDTSPEPRVELSHRDIMTGEIPEGAHHVRVTAPASPETPPLTLSPQDVMQGDIPDAAGVTVTTPTPSTETPAKLNLGRIYNLNPPATIRDIQFCTGNGIGINTIGMDARVLISTNQWQAWHQQYPVVRYSYATDTNTACWDFQQNATTNIVLTSGAGINSIIAPATNGFTIRSAPGNVVIVRAIDWVPGYVIPYDAHGIAAEQWSPGIQFPPPTAEERLHRMQFEENNRIYREKENAAWLRAEQLLHQYLDREQRREWKRNKQFNVQVGDRRYRIKSGRSSNVELVDRAGEVLERYCCHPVEMVPTGDCVLTQMLMLLYEEERFLQTANVHYTAPGFTSQKKRLKTQEKPVDTRDDRIIRIAA